MSDPNITPVRIKAPHGAKTTEIQWADGHRCVYPNTLLRGYCPCAGCQGHSGETRFIEGGNSELRDLQPVGNYALKFVWADGHETGLYSFRHLRSLCDKPECEHHAPSADASES
ncbi:MAG: DUF971 domain-containing protein [Polyangiaceae bacterium]